jgi:diadenosine tetraphosphatase ApaH/serine/threonine PP2A family protein phosphatase
MVPEARRVVEWTRDQLSAEQLAFLAALPISATEGEALFVHANAFAPSEWAYVDCREAAAQSIAATPCRLTFCGHTHNPMLFHRARNGRVGEFHPVPGVPIYLTPQRRWLAIPGSAGQPRDGNPAACYAVYEPSSARLTYHRVPYDHRRAGARIVAAGLPRWLADRLHDGR